MSDIDFQNGFICGLAAKGLVRSGELYKPIVWNDSGEYSYFYIDFRRAMQVFSTGMYNESIVMHDSMQIKATGVEYIRMGVYKVFADIADLPHGLTVMNKKTGRLRFSSGELLPVFSVHMFIAGQDGYIDGGYIYDRTMRLEHPSTITELIADFEFWEQPEQAAVYESLRIPSYPAIATETHTITIL